MDCAFFSSKKSAYVYLFSLFWDSVAFFKVKEAEVVRGATCRVVFSFL